MPFPRNPDFVGRTDDLDRLDAALHKREPVGIRPTGLTGMGGIGKTQLAVEYVYRHKADYPGGIFWVNAAEPLAQGLAQIGARLCPDVLDRSPDHQLRVAFERLARRSDTLLVFDNLDDPAQLTRPVGSEASPLTLGCSILFTTRHRDLGRFHPIEVSVLPEEPALQLLLRHESRHAVRNNPDHHDRPEAEAICRLLGWLPLAIELASAFLAHWPSVTLTEYRNRLKMKGCLTVLDSEAGKLARINFQPIHNAAVAATLLTQWEALEKVDDEVARLLFRVLGQFPESAIVSAAMLGLFAGVSDDGEAGTPSALRRALRQLHNIRLVEELHVNRIRLHPLVREFASSLTPSSKSSRLRHDCARRVVQAFEHLAVLENMKRAGGIDGLQETLMAAMDFISGSKDRSSRALTTMLQVLRREAPGLRTWELEERPNYFIQQVLFRAGSLQESVLAARAERRLRELGQTPLVLRWRTLCESTALVRILDEHRQTVTSVAVTLDGRHALTGSEDGTAAVWDLATGQRLRLLEGHRGPVFSVAVSPDGRHAFTGSEDGTAAVWDLATGRRLRVLDGHRNWVNSVAVSPDGRQVVTGSDDRTLAVWDPQTGQLLTLVSLDSPVQCVAWSPDGRSLIAADDHGDLYCLEYRER